MPKMTPNPHCFCLKFGIVMFFIVYIFSLCQNMQVVWKLGYPLSIFATAQCPGFRLPQGLNYDGGALYKLLSWVGIHIPFRSVGSES